MSQIHINFSMTLNLLLSHSLLGVKELLERSFAAFQGTKAASSLQKRWDQTLTAIEKALPHGKCNTSDPFEVVENIDKRSEFREGKGGTASFPCNECRCLKGCPGKRKGKLSTLLKTFRLLSAHL